MQRRTFLTSMLALTGGVLGWKLGFGNDSEAIARVLQKRLPYLRLDPHGVERFCRDMTATGKISRFRLRLIHAAGAVYSSFEPPDGSRLDRMMRHGEDRIVTDYLLSSDFFRHGADTSRTVQYLGFYDPLVACNNPFACRATDPIQT